ncbi:MAG TPA: hypothetical protein VFG54_05050 [Prolixibacteraceae bacterium]|nr:hypothetical protein [Prolixibacteraceae bacterium]
MAKLPGGVNGPISGTAGPVTLYTVEGKVYMRGAIKPRSKDSWSNKQVSYRKRVSQVGQLWKSLANNPARDCWRASSKPNPGFSLFLKTNLPAFSEDGSHMDLEWFHMSTGKLPLPHLLKASPSAADPSTWEISWQNDSGKGGARSDDALMVMVAQDNEFSHPIATGFIRKQQNAAVKLPELPIGAKGIYVSFRSKDEKSQSIDQFFKA